MIAPTSYPPALVVEHEETLATFYRQRGEVRVLVVLQRLDDRQGGHVYRVVFRGERDAPDGSLRRWEVRVHPSELDETIVALERARTLIASSEVSR